MPLNSYVPSVLHVERIFEALALHFQDAQIELQYETPYQLLLAVVLSAQSTDKAVNKVTQSLFKTVKEPQDLTVYSLQDLESKIMTLGLFKTKAYALKTLSDQLILRHQGRIPENFEALVDLQGVGRKTAHVVLNELYHHPVIAVDTHVYRVSHRLGLSHSLSRDKVGDDLMNIIPQKYLKKAHHYLIFLGRRLCQAKAPKCSSCFLSPYCAFYQHQKSIEVSKFQNIPHDNQAQIL